MALPLEAVSHGFGRGGSEDDMYLELFVEGEGENGTSNQSNGAA